MTQPLRFARACAAQGRACARLGSPFMARLLPLLGDRLGPDLPLGRRLHGWPGDITATGAAVPLRLAGALHALVLDGSDPALAQAYAGAEGMADDALWAVLHASLARHEDRLDRWLDHAPQTNEVRRSAVLIAAGHWLTARFGLPFVLSELGASAGLNLIWDRHALDLPGRRLGPDDAALTLAPDWTGPPPPPAAAAPRIAQRAGVDLNPLDPAADLLRLLAYLWPDQPDRIDRTRRAAAEAARSAPPVDRGDAADWLETRLARARPGHLHLVFHTVAWQYFPPATQARCEAALARAGAAATAAAPLARLAMEADASPGSAAVTLTLWPGGDTITLGRADFHGRAVTWTAPDLPESAAPLS